MKKIAPHLILLNLLCIFSLLILFIMLLKTSSSQNVFILHDTPPRSSEIVSVITSSGKININNASTKELMQIPGIGEKLSQRIVEYRDKNGDFKSIDELLNIKGIGAKTLEKIAYYISTGE